LKDTDGREAKLGDFKDKALIICFVATWDKPSQKQISILAEVAKEYADRGLAVLGFALEQSGKQTVKSYVETDHPSFRFLAVDYSTIMAFGGIGSIPMTFVIDKNHYIIRSYVGIAEKKTLATDLKIIFEQ
jgi:thiol-disulfide isomerase/thioredoxin